MRRYRHVIKPTGLAALLALLIALGGQPFLHAEAPGTRAPFCREDGVCLPAPRLIIPDVTSAQTDLYGPIAGEACEEAVLVKRAGDVTPQAFGRLLAARGYAHVEGLLTPGWWRVCLPYAEGTTAAAAQAAVSALESLPEIALVEHDGLAHAADTLLPWDLGPSDRRGVQLRAPQGPATGANAAHAHAADTLLPWGLDPSDRRGVQLRAPQEPATGAPDGLAHAAGAPNDPFFGAQWGLEKIGAPDAWDTITGSNSVMIAVIDSGFDYAHPDGPQELWLGWDYVNYDDDPYDDYGHGTHVMGIAAARTNNGVGIAGLCPGCSALAIKVLGSSGSGSWSGVADGIVLAADATTALGKRVIINLSLGGDYSSIVADAVTYARSQGCVVVAAAGNYGPGPTMFPASLPGVIAVSATDDYDRPAAPPYATFSSQYGDLGAPGVFIYALRPLPTGYGYMNGTSMASPHVTAAAGLVWSLHPTYTAFQVRLAVLDNVDVPTGWNPLFGIGRLNVASAVSAPEIVLKNVYLPLVLR